MPVNLTSVIQTSDVPISKEKLTDYEGDFVLLVPKDGERETNGQTRFGERPSVKVDAYVFKNGKAYDLGTVPVFQGTIRALIRHATMHDSVVAGIMTKENNRWNFAYDPANKAHATAMKALVVRVESSDAEFPPES